MSVVYINVVVRLQRAWRRLQRRRLWRSPVCYTYGGVEETGEFCWVSRGLWAIERHRTPRSIVYLPNDRVSSLTTVERRDLRLVSAAA